MPRAEWAQVAHDLRALAESIDAAIEPASREAVPAAGASAPPTPAPAARLPQRPPQESAFTECPAHRKPFQDGRFGPFCSGQEPEGAEHDGNWYNDKGYCRVTPKSAGAWLKQHPKGAPAPVPAAPMDSDEGLPF